MNIKNVKQLRKKLHDRSCGSKLIACPLCGKYNREATIDEEVILFKKFSKKVTRTKKTAIKFLSRAGITDKKGNLKKEYGGTA